MGYWNTDLKEKMSRYKKKTGENKTGLTVTGYIILAIELVFSVIFEVLIVRAALLPALYEVLIGVVLAALLFVMWLLIRKNYKRVRYIIGDIISLLLSAAMIVGSLAVGDLTSALKTITDTTEEVTRVGVYVRADDSAETIQDAADYPFGILESRLREDTDNAISQIEEEISDSISTSEYTGMSDLADALLSEEVDAMIISEDFVEMLTEAEGYEDFEDEVREIASYEWVTIVASEDSEDSSEDSSAQTNPEDCFIMYISGIDTYGSVSTKSRSDVNILAAVNTSTREILLVSTPRDYYVELSISDGEKDKLTHAGIYGVNVSMETLEMLYDINIDYYFRINFTGFEDLIDALGGITVDSEYSFEVGDHTFVEGENYLDGEAALAFARERYSFSSGDRQRGENQMAVIEGVIDKLLTPAILQNFSDILDGLEGSFETDMSYDYLSDLVQMQLSEGGSWNVTSYSVDGTGTYAATYSMNQSLYVMIPDESTVEEAQSLINEVLSGE